MPNKSPVRVKRGRAQAAVAPLAQSSGRPFAATGSRAPAPARNQHVADSESDPVQFARLVARLEAELADMRARLHKAEARAMLDPLTELLNRRGFAAEVARADAHVKRYGGRAVLAYLDLDGFKAINDRHGHAAGDATLQAVAAALRRTVRASDSVARLGGDEFAVLLWNLSDADAEAKARALERTVALTRIDWLGTSLSVGASAGITSLAGPDLSTELAKADAAMYRRKRARRGG